MKEYSPFDFRICALTKKPSFGAVTEMELNLLRIVRITENSGTFDCQNVFQDTEMGSLASVKNGCYSAPWSLTVFPGFGWFISSLEQKLFCFVYPFSACNK